MLQGTHVSLAPSYVYNAQTALVHYESDEQCVPVYTCGSHLTLEPKITLLVILYYASCMR